MIYISVMSGINSFRIFKVALNKHEHYLVLIIKRPRIEWKSVLSYYYHMYIQKFKIVEKPNALRNNNKYISQKAIIAYACIYLFLNFYWVYENLFKFSRSAHFGHESKQNKQLIYILFLNIDFFTLLTSILVWGRSLHRRNDAMKDSYWMLP